MADEATQAPAEGQDTPDESAPQVEDTREPDAPEQEASTADEEVDWEKRYNDLRPDYDRKSAALKEAEQAAQLVQALQSDDPQERAWAASLLNIEFDEDDDTPDDEQEEEQFRDPRVDGLLEERQAEQHEKQLAELEQYVDGQIDELDKKHKTELDDSEKEWIWAKALSLPPDEQNRPNVSKAFEEFTGIMDNRIKKYRESKRDAPSPPAPGGSPGSRQVDLSDRKTRLEHANQVAQRALAREQ